MDGKLGPTIQKNMITITVYPRFNKTKTSPWLGLAHQKSRFLKLWTRRLRQRKVILPLKPRERSTVITTIIMTRTGEERKPKLQGHIRFGDNISM
jgi:hypothetical protein